MDWPNDADGDVLRRLFEDGFDFERVVQIDFNVDFAAWPPPGAALKSIESAYPDASLSLENEDQYVLVQLSRQLTYELVVTTQAKLTALTKSYRGYCDSWGVLYS